jgi:hypothetical protein
MLLDRSDSGSNGITADAFDGLSVKGRSSHRGGVNPVPNGDEDIVRGIGRLALPHGMHLQVRAVRVAEGQREGSLGHVQASSFRVSMDEQTGQAEAECSRFA